VWNVGPWTRDDVLDLSDLKPALVDISEMVKRLGADSVDIIGNPQTAQSPAR
jgi:hypothetical protein